MAIRYPQVGMNGVAIQPFSRTSAHAEVIASWVRHEWGTDGDEIAELFVRSDSRPEALVAMHDATPVGVLAYKRYKAEFQTEFGLWINALYVLPEFRRRGIGRKLVGFGTNRSHVFPAHEIFVFTDIPSLYLSCGWDHVTTDAKGMHTLVYRLLT